MAGTRWGDDAIAPPPPYARFWGNILRKIMKRNPFKMKWTKPEDISKIGIG